MKSSVNLAPTLDGPLLQKQVTSWLAPLSGKATRLTFKDTRAAEVSLFNYTLQALPLVWSDLVAEEHVSPLHDKCSLVVKDAYVGIHASLQSTLAMLETDLLGRVNTAEAYNIKDGKHWLSLAVAVVVCVRLHRLSLNVSRSPKNWQSKSDTRNSSPAGEEVTLRLCFVLGIWVEVTGNLLREQLQFWSAWRVVGNDGLNDGVNFVEFGPEAIPVGRTTDWRAALVTCVTIGDIFRGERQIVKACLRRDLNAILSGGLQ